MPRAIVDGVNNPVDGVIIVIDEVQVTRPRTQLRQLGEVGRHPPRLLVGDARPRSISLLNPPTWGYPKRREKGLLSPRLGPGNKGTAKSFGLGKGAESCLDKQQFAWGY